MNVSCVRNRKPEKVAENWTIWGGQGEKKISALSKC